MSKKLIVRNRSLTPLNEVKAEGGGKSYKYTGIFTPANGTDVNRNGRIYDESEVLPHLAYLRDKIKKEGCILGELDHPDGRFEISLKEASHKITDLWWDKEKKCVMGTLELLDTPNGKTMKAIVDAGCPLFVSSRAAGSVGKDSHVAIQQIFTYDIVSVPGFEQCKLDRVNESLRTSLTSFMNESVAAQKGATDLNKAESLGMDAGSFQILESDETPKITVDINGIKVNKEELYRPMSEDVQVNVTPEKAAELGLDQQPQQPEGDMSGETGGEEPAEEPVQHNAEDIIDIVPEYKEQGTDAIQDIQPEYSTKADGPGADPGAAGGGPAIGNENPFNESMDIQKIANSVYRSCMKGESLSLYEALQNTGYTKVWDDKKAMTELKKELKKLYESTDEDDVKDEENPDYDPKIDISEEDPDGGDETNEGCAAPEKKDGTEEVDESERTKPNAVKDGKLGSEADNIGKQAREKEKKIEESEEPLEEADTKPNAVKDGKLGSEADNIGKQAREKEKKEETDGDKDEIDSNATGKNDKVERHDSAGKVTESEECDDDDCKCPKCGKCGKDCTCDIDEACGDLERKKNDVCEGTRRIMDRYNLVLESHGRRQSVRESIIAKYPFSVSLSEQEFNKFAQLNDDDKQLCADWIWEQRIFDIRQINALWQRPLTDRALSEKNYIRLADKADIDLYNAAPEAVRKSIDEMAACYILESKADVDEFWARTGLRHRQRDLESAREEIEGFNEAMQTDVRNDGTPYGQGFINLIESMMTEE